MKSIKQIFLLIKQKGIIGFSKSLIHKIIKPRIPDYKFYLSFFLNKKGLEIGGPSSFFSKNGLLPLYPVVAKLDGCNFNKYTIWQKNIDNSHYNYENHKYGNQYICEATEITKAIPADNYDFVISCNVLEHIANSMKAINEWLKILKSSGTLLIIVPNKQSNFDHQRSTTKFEHLLDDFKRNIGEDDLSHLEEILKYHDLRLDVRAGSFEAFKVRSLKNFENRALHQHIFDLSLLKQVFNYFNLKILKENEINTDFIILGKKQS